MFWKCSNLFSCLDVLRKISFFKLPIFLAQFCNQIKFNKIFLSFWKFIDIWQSHDCLKIKNSRNIFPAPWLKKYLFNKKRLLYISNFQSHISGSLRNIHFETDIPLLELNFLTFDLRGQMLKTTQYKIDRSFFITQHISNIENLHPF